MPTARTILLAALALLAGGCARDTIAMQLTSEPSGAPISYRVVDAADPGRALTPWYSLGVTPVAREVEMHPSWSLPSSMLEFQLELPGHAPQQRLYSPAAILTDARYLKDHLFLDRAPPAPAPSDPAAPPAR